MWAKALRWLVVGLFIGLGLGAVIGLALSRFVDFPAVEALTSYRPAAATQVLARVVSRSGLRASRRSFVTR
jgi:membrane carboxypeptidase/penicillin-binding protein